MSRTESISKESPIPQETKRKDSLSYAVVVSWMAHFVQIATGFIVPRMIDQGFGPAVLGIWDLSWTLISYLEFLEMGIGSSVNRYIALYKEKGDIVELNRVVSSVNLVQSAIALLIAGLTILMVIFLPRIHGFEVPADLQQARWLVAMLGGGSAVVIGGAVYGGILTGCHRWGLHQGIQIATNLTSLVGMVIIMMMGYGLLAIGAVYLTTTILGRLVRMIVSRWVCPGLEIKFHHFDIGTAKKMLHFGGKMFIVRMCQGLMIQTTGLLIAMFLGPAALAIFVRPRSLVRQAAMVQQKFCFVLVPSVAKLSAEPLHSKKVKNFAISCTKTGLYIALPLILMLAISGKSILLVWMGPEYESGLLISILALGFLGEIAYAPLMNVLFGLDRHGPTAIFSALGGATSIACVWFLLFQGTTDLSMIALALVVPWTLANGVALPVYACRILGIRHWELLKAVWPGPLACVLPFGIVGVMGNYFFPRSPLISLGIALGVGGFLIFICYWIWVIPNHWKLKLLKFWPRSQHANTKNP